MSRRKTHCACCLLLSLCLYGWAQEPMPSIARMIDGNKFPAALAGIGASEVRFLSANKEQIVPLDDLLDWGQPAEVRKSSYLLLVDGGVLAGEVMSITADHVLIRSARRPGLWKPSRVLRKEVAAIVYQSSAHPAEREQADDKLLRETDLQDRLLLLDGDSLRGSLLDTATSEEEGMSPLVRFLIPGGKEPLRIPQDRVVAAVLGKRATSAIESAGFWLGLADGSVIHAVGVSPADEIVSIVLASGTTLEAAAVDADVEPPESFWSRVTFLQPYPQRVTYLSDLKTIGFKHVPLLGWEQDYANDRSVSRSRLRADGRSFVKGIGMPATSRLAYEIPEGAKRFEAEIAIDDDAGRAASVIFRVFLESTGGSWKPAFESKTLRGGDDRQSVRIELGDARRLALVADMADQGDQRDWADWLNGRFVK